MLEFVTFDTLSKSPTSDGLADPVPLAVAPHVVPLAVVGVHLHTVLHVTRVVGLPGGPVRVGHGRKVTPNVT